MWCKKEVELKVPEQWRKYDDQYWISDQGRVMRKYKNGTISYLTPISRKSPSDIKYGKLCKSVRVKLHNKYYTLNKLMWETFKGPIPEGYTVVNAFGNSTFNEIYNLKLISISDVNKRSNRPTSKPIIDITNGLVYPSARYLGRKLNVSHTTIANWCDKKVSKRPLRFEWYNCNKKYKQVVRFVRKGTDYGKI